MALGSARRGHAKPFLSEASSAGDDYSTCVRLAADLGVTALNTSDIYSWLLLAEGAAEGQATGPNMWFPLAAMAVFFYLLLWRPQQKKQQETRDMLANLKEKDHVVTIGGIHGVITGVQREQDVVTLRIDEATGAKIKVGLSAISRLVVDEDKKDK